MLRFVTHDHMEVKL